MGLANHVANEAVIVCMTLCPSRCIGVCCVVLLAGRIGSNPAFSTAASQPSLEMENEEKIYLDARRRLEEQLKQYRVQRHKERVSISNSIESRGSVSQTVPRHKERVSIANSTKCRDTRRGSVFIATGQDGRCTLKLTSG